MKYITHFALPTLLSLSLQSLATWESENKIYCQQTLVDGDGPKTYWTRELNGDELILVSYSNESPLRSDLRGRSEKMKNSINTKAPEFESFTNSNFWPSKTKKKKKNNKKENDHNHKILF